MRFLLGGEGKGEGGREPMKFRSEPDGLVRSGAASAAPCLASSICYRFFSVSCSYFQRM